MGIVIIWLVLFLFLSWGLWYFDSKQKDERIEQLKADRDTWKIRYCEMANQFHALISKVLPEIK